MNAKPPLDTVDYEAIEAAVMETPRGRWFLSEYLRRHQAKETERLLAAIARLERALEREAAISPRMRAVLMGTAASLCRHVSNNPPSLPVVAEAMATEAKSIAESLSTLERIETDKKTAEASAEIENNEKAEAQNLPALADLACRQWELAAQMETLARGLAELAALVDVDTPMEGVEPIMPADALQWFAAHDDLFDASEGDRTAQPGSRPRAETAPPSAQTETPVHVTAATGESSAEDSPDDNGEAREGHLTVLIRPRRSDETEREPAPVSGRKLAASKGKSESSATASSQRQTRIIIRHKSSSEEVAIPFLEGADSNNDG